MPEADDRRVSDELRGGTTKRSKRLLTLMPFALPFRERARLFAHRVRPEGGSNARAEEVRFFDENAGRDRTVVRVRRSHALDRAVIQRHFNLGALNALLPGKGSTFPRDDRPPKDEPNRVENDRDTRF